MSSQPETSGDGHAGSIPTQPLNVAAFLTLSWEPTYVEEKEVTKSLSLGTHNPLVESGRGT